MVARSISRPWHGAPFPLLIANRPRDKQAAVWLLSLPPYPHLALRLVRPLCRHCRHCRHSFPPASPEPPTPASAQVGEHHVVVGLDASGPEAVAAYFSEHIARRIAEVRRVLPPCS